MQFDSDLVSRPHPPEDTDFYDRRKLAALIFTTAVFAVLQSGIEKQRLSGSQTIDHFNAGKMDLDQLLEETTKGQRITVEWQNLGLHIISVKGGNPSPRASGRRWADRAVAAAARFGVPLTEADAQRGKCASAAVVRSDSALLMPSS
ncbi:unnamed protein product [Soboliphyme baturini]|uniref:PINc domain-containing protein n=1 Tax=Soboliphyme baturini TaxID=241478 RepID=A0A183IBQ7_9BILA|nr:unnamed protein product [Soboliphyme baturini]